VNSFEVTKMKRFFSINLSQFLGFAFVLLATAVINAQEPMPQNNLPEKRPQLIQQLDLSPEQIQKIRGIHRETREQMRAATQRLQQARRDLDAAIYAEESTASEVEQRSKALSDAQTEVTKLRAKTEFRIRQILTPEQLIRFRELRKQTGENNLLRKRRSFPANRPNKPFPLRNPK
jgi:Spy/CpxP family protein refolding chaperone